MKTATLGDLLIDARAGFACGENPADGVFQFRMNNVTRDGQFDFSKVRRVPASSHKLADYFLAEGDVLFNATNSPELVGKTAYVTPLHEPAVFSNHFLRLRPKESLANGRYLSLWLQKRFHERAFEGMCRQWVGQATVNRDQLLAQQIPLPPLPEQRRIAHILDRAETLRAQRRLAIAQLDALAEAIFLDMFGDPIKNSSGWVVTKVDDVCELVRGSSPRPQGDPRFFGGPVPRLMVADITRDGRLVTPRIDSLTLEGAKRSRPVPAGTVVMAVSGNVGLVSRLAIDACVHDGFVAFKELDESRCDPGYLLAVLHLMKRTHEASKAGAIFLNITTSDIKAMHIPLPPIQLQRRYLERLDQRNRIAVAMGLASEQADALFASLQHRAFRGEL